jgi:catechol 2,3-dioxygenase-like lactoylglutathione lyase family enzyme
MKYSVSVDVPSLEEGLRFYREALGLAEVARPVATYAILKCGEAQIGLFEKSAGTRPAKGSDDVRRYERHWTPVHIDFHVDDFDADLARALEAGVANRNSTFKGDHPSPFAAIHSGMGSASSAQIRKHDAPVSLT